MQIWRRSMGACAVLAVVSTVGCRVDTTKNGDNKDVKIATPFGGMHVKTDDNVVPGEIGLPLYPGATVVRKEGKDSGSADVNMSFGSFQLRVKAVTYRTNDGEEKVEAFYRDGLKRYGDVIACRGERTVGTPTQTREGLTCENHRGDNNHINVDSDMGSHSLELKTGSKQHQHVVTLDPDGGGTKFGLVALDLPGKLFSDDSSDGDRQ